MKWIGYKSLADISTYFFPAGIAVKKDDALVSITDTSFSDAGNGGELNLNSDDGVAMANTHRLGVINFKGAEDASSTLTIGARIEATCDATWSATENGASLAFYTTDGNASQSLAFSLNSDQRALFPGLIQAQGGINILNTATSSSSQGGTLKLQADDEAALGNGHRLGVIEFQATIDSGGTLNTGSKIEAIAENAWGEEEASTTLKFYTTDSATENLVLTLDSNKLARFEGAVTVAGALTGTLATASQTNITGVGTISTGTWQGTAIASAYLDSDTAHLSGAQTITGVKTFGTTTKLQFRDANAYINSPDSNDIEIAATDITIDAAGKIINEADTVRFDSPNANDPLVILKNTTDDATSGRLRFLNQRGADGQDNDETGVIEFYSYDDGTPTGLPYSRIYGTIHDATNNEESGKLQVQVASHDGGMEDGLVLTGGSADAEVDVTIGNGTDSVTTIAGNLVVSGSTVIKILPVHFMQNEDGGVNKSVQYDDTGTIGVRSSSADGELYAFVEIPFGKTATSVTIYGNDSGNTVEVFEADINASGLTDKTPGGGCVVGSACDMTDVAADATNYLAIKVTVTATSDIIYGGSVTVSG